MSIYKGIRKIKNDDSKEAKGGTKSTPENHLIVWCHHQMMHARHLPLNVYLSHQE